MPVVKLEMMRAERTEIKWVWVCKAASLFPQYCWRQVCSFRLSFRQSSVAFGAATNRTQAPLSPSEAHLPFCECWGQAVSMRCSLAELPRVCRTPGPLPASPVPLPQLWLPSHSFLEQLLPAPTTSLFLRQAVTLTRWWAMWHYNLKHLGSHVENHLHTAVLWWVDLGWLVRVYASHSDSLRASPDETNSSSPVVMAQYLFHEWTSVGEERVYFMLSGVIIFPPPLPILPHSFNPAPVGIRLLSLQGL